MPSAIDVFYLENNPYDCAALDSLFEREESRFSLHYSFVKDGVVLPLDIRYLESWLKENEGKVPCIVLFDLALTRKCESAFADRNFIRWLEDKNLCSEVTALLRHDKKDFRSIAELTIALGMFVQDQSERNRERIRAYLQEGSACRELLNSSTLGKGVGKLACIAEGDDLDLLFAYSHEFIEECWDVDAASIIMLSKAPSLMRIMAFVAAHEKVCCGVVSNYVNENSVFAIREVLAVRYVNPYPKVKEMLFGSLLFRKERLRDPTSYKTITDQLAESFNAWKLHADPKVYLAPFSELLLDCGGIMRKKFHRIIEEWQILASRGNEENTCHVVWDTTGLFIGGKYSWNIETGVNFGGWSTIMRRVDAAAEGAAISKPSMIKQEGTKYFLITKRMDTRHDGEQLAGAIKAASTQFPARMRFVFVGGSRKALLRFQDSLKDAQYPVRVYAVPYASRKRKLGLGVMKSLIRSIPVVPKDSKGLVCSAVMRDSEDMRKTVDNRIFTTDFGQATSDVLGRGRANSLVRMIGSTMVKSDNPNEIWELLIENLGKLLDRIQDGEQWEKVAIDLGVIQKFSYLY